MSDRKFQIVVEMQSLAAELKDILEKEAAAKQAIPAKITTYEEATLWAKDRKVQVEDLPHPAGRCITFTSAFARIDKNLSYNPSVAERKQVAIEATQYLLEMETKYREQNGQAK